MNDVDDRFIRQIQAAWRGPIPGRGWKNCGWAATGKRPTPWCYREGREILPSQRCPCRHWVKRSIRDRIRGRVGR